MERLNRYEHLQEGLLRKGRAARWKSEHGQAILPSQAEHCQSSIHLKNIDLMI